MPLHITNGDSAVDVIAAFVYLLTCCRGATPCTIGLVRCVILWMSSLYPQHVRISQLQLATAQQFWLAICASELSKLMRLWSSAGEQLTELPLLAPAVSRYLQDFLWASDGLTRTERQLLKSNV